MEWREKPSILRRGAAPPDERRSWTIVLVAAAVHLLLLPVISFKLKPPTEISLPSGISSPSRMKLVKLAPMRTMAAPEPSAPEKAQPKPALLKKFTQNARITMKEERAPVKKPGAKTETTKPAPPHEREKEAVSVDLLPRWFSSDSTKSTSAKVDGDFRFAAYLAQIRNKIGGRWVPPQGVDARGRAVKTVLFFRIHRDGQISESTVESSSGYAFFDQTAMRALLAATPLPPLPAGFPDNDLGVHFGFEFEQ